MYTDIQLEAIRLFGRKELSFGCVVLIKDNTDAKVNYYYICKDDYDGDCIFIETFEEGYENTILEYEKEEYKILGHIPHLEDLFRVAEEKKLIYEFKKIVTYKLCFYGEYDVHYIPYNPTLPLLDQPSLPDIISLFK